MFAERFSLVVAAALLVLSAWCAEENTSKAPAKMTDDQVTKLLAERKVNFQFVDTKLSAALEAFEKAADVKVTLDADAKKLADTAINLKVTKMQAELALQWILRLVDLSYKIENGAVVIKKK
jgi:hypothetical protein